MLNYKYKTEGFDLWRCVVSEGLDDSYKRIRVRVQLMGDSFFRIDADVFIKAVMGYRCKPWSCTFKASKTGVRNEFLTPVNSF